ncbi:uncharacterized protein LY79DRAFT_674167 [Colletotrichum navitas]|uniref:Uncharacterized protein n=1 Tax=Colletotrichum navitas TaxID=681940 RepID=A0AAD8PM21_9PEZI|nr:uncharacterized protein LY79DRAFT_674167 [Colletotrichum navitas]KAK1570215.1 hypothetical protein LY79DRAFT_674167 [Colletotrichum navitas]
MARPNETHYHGLAINPRMRIHWSLKDRIVILSHIAKRGLTNLSGIVEEQRQPVELPGGRLDDNTVVLIKPGAILPAPAAVPVTAPESFLNPGMSPFIKRPGFNTTGKPVNLEVNQFRVKQWNNNVTIYQYDVTISLPPLKYNVVFRKC